MAGAGFVALNTTAAAASAMTQVSITPATVRARVRGWQMGNTAATAAAAVRFNMNRQTADGTSSTITAANTQLDPSSGVPATAAKSTYTVTGTDGVVIGDWGWDVVGTYVLWYPPGIEPFAVAATNRIALKKISTENQLYAGQLYWCED